MRREPHEPALPRGAPVRSGRRTLLVVDDDAAIREALAVVLRIEGYAVRTAGNGLDALLALRMEGRADAIVLDLEMPLMSGSEFREAQLGDPTLADIPVLVLSASTRAVAADRRMAKPVELDELVRAVRELAGPP